MNDYVFGNKIHRLRKAMGISQNQLADMLGITGKAISKWENGCAKPQIDTIKKLAAIFNVSVDDLLCSSAPDKQITKIVITGGPCAGKTTALCKIQEHFSQLGYCVIFIPEAATELITGGIAPWTLNTNLDYQLCLLQMQMQKEEIFEKAAEAIFGHDKILLVCDRGTMDNRAYMSDAEFSRALSALDLNVTELRDRYDAVFHLVSAAKGAEAFYTLADNAARTETVEEAAAIDDRLIAAWTGHPHLRVIDNATDFQSKLSRLIAEIASFLGEPEPFEIERKFLIEYPQIKLLEADPNCRRVEIIQTYLRASDGDEVRVRQRGENGHYIYFKTTKRTVSGAKRVEIESRLSKEEYLTHLMEADTSKKQIRKTRYCLMYKNQYFEIDVYPFWDDKAILEIELCDENDSIRFPSHIRVIKEVTDDPSYKNAALADR